MYSVQLWDTPGQEAFRNVTKLHLMDANVVVIVFDYSSQNVTEQQNLLDVWHEFVTKNTNTSNCGKNITS